MNLQESATDREVEAIREAIAEFSDALRGAFSEAQEEAWNRLKEAGLSGRSLAAAQVTVMIEVSALVASPAFAMLLGMFKEDRAATVETIQGGFQLYQKSTMHHATEIRKRAGEQD